MGKGKKNKGNPGQPQTPSESASTPQKQMSQKEPNPSQPSGIDIPGQSAKPVVSSGPGPVQPRSVNPDVEAQSSDASKTKRNRNRNNKNQGQTPASGMSTQMKTEHAPPIQGRKDGDNIQKQTKPEFVQASQSVMSQNPQSNPKSHPSQWQRGPKSQPYPHSASVQPQTQVSHPRQSPSVDVSGQRSRPEYVEVPQSAIPQNPKSHPSQWQRGPKSQPQPPHSTLVQPQTQVSQPRQSPGIDVSGLSLKTVQAPQSAMPLNPQHHPSQSQQGPSSQPPLPQSTVTQPSTPTMEKGKNTPSPVECNFIIPRRKNLPENDRRGRKITLDTNFLQINLKARAQKIIHYDVAMTPDKPKKLLMKVFNEYNKNFFSNLALAFDGMKNMYSPMKLNIPNNIHCGEVTVLDDSDKTKRIKFEIKIQYAAEVDLQTLTSYMKDGCSQNPPQSALQCLDVILRHGCHEKFVRVARSFYTSPGPDAYSLGEGVDLWYGKFQSAIVGWKLLLNIDVAHKGFSKEQSVLNLIYEFDYKREVAPNRPLPYNVLNDFKKYIKRMKIVYQLPNAASSKRVVIVKDLDSSPMKKTFKGSDGKTISVFDYYLREKKYRIQYPEFPCIVCGKNNVCYPAELCTVVGGQPITAKLSATQTTKLIRQAATKPYERRKKIEHLIHTAKYNQDAVIKHFGIDINERFENVPARILDAPKLKYGNEEVSPNNGVWNASNFFTAASLERWDIIMLGRLDPNKINNFVSTMKNAGRKMGIQIRDPKIYQADKRYLRDKFIDAIKNGLQLACIILDRPEDYAHVKKTAEIQCGVLTQCIKRNTIERMNMSTAGMILQKLNAKLGHTNHIIAPVSKPKCLSRPCMIVGADVTHPGPGSENQPSFVAVTASHDPYAFKYSTVLRVQDPKLEIIKDFDTIMRQQLQVFYSRTQRQPLHIIYFRDGVSEGQFSQVLGTELRLIRAACTSLNSDYKPEISVFVVQKRHHTRFFSNNKNDTDRNGNLLAGTCVDRNITHPTEIDFYLLSHASIQGTSRPTRYHCIWDDADMNEDEIEHLAYYLCHLYGRCTRAVSYPTPTYYAHLGAERAKVYAEGELIDLQDLSKTQEKLKVCQKILNENPMYFI